MNKPNFLTMCMSPTLQKTLVFSGFVKDMVNRTGEYRLDVSGKGINVSRVLTQLGKDCCHLTQLGGTLRPLFLELCRMDGIKVEWVESSSPIRFCYTLIDRADKSVTELVEESERVGDGTEKRLLDAFSLSIKKYSALIISGTKAAGFSDELVPEMVRQARELGCKIILDLRGQDLVRSLPFKPDIIKPNLFEFVSTFAPELISGKIIRTTGGDLKERVGRIWAELHEKYACSLVLTRGSDSVWYAEKGELLEHNIKPVEVLNSTGSGDAFTAGLSAAYGEGASLGEAVAEGARCGALNAAILRSGIIA